MGAAVTLSDLKRLLANTNVAAFHGQSASAESSQDDSAYTVLNGGIAFHVVRRASITRASARHPAKRPAPYQFIASTWGDVEQQ